LSPSCLPHEGSVLQRVAAFKTLGVALAGRARDMRTSRVEHGMTEITVDCFPQTEFT